jgi:Bacterial capsule synthesis protein PGA_cap
VPERHAARPRRRPGRGRADAVVGTHAHLLLGGGHLGRTYVAYGLGNFLWWRDAAFANDTGVLTLTFRGRPVEASRLIAARIDGAGRPAPTTGDASAAVLRTWDRVHACSGLPKSRAAEAADG